MFHYTRPGSSTADDFYTSMHNDPFTVPSNYSRPDHSKFSYFDQRGTPSWIQSLSRAGIKRGLRLMKDGTPITYAESIDHPTSGEKFYYDEYKKLELICTWYQMLQVDLDSEKKNIDCILLPENLRPPDSIGGCNAKDSDLYDFAQEQFTNSFQVIFHP